jgi:hypothetical protein
MGRWKSDEGLKYHRDSMDISTFCSKRLKRFALKVQALGV